jgi:L-alanine-DL-glutamate epimerase-like enolase superfamily enzyme
MNHPTPSLSARIERWPIAEPFAISRGAKTEAIVLVAELHDGTFRGRGECVPYARYGETVPSVMEAMTRMATEISRGLNREGLQNAMPPGAARNALDCAFWDLAAKRAGRPVHELVGVSAPKPLTTAYTISLGTPQAMGEAAAKARRRKLLKVKLGAPGDPARIAAVRAAAPQCELIVDANEGWTPEDLAGNLSTCTLAGVTLIEQPLPAERDEALRDVPRPIPVCADESVHARTSFPALAGKYDAVNIKLDKAGGLTEALAMAREAESLGFAIMVGCMVATSLSIAPAMLLAQRARFVDLDGALLLERDRPDALRYDGSSVFPAGELLWG